MKKLSMIFALAIAFTMGTKAYAQEGLSFGVKAGANFSNISGDSFDDFKMKLGFQLGATVEYGFTENLFLGSGLEFTTKGARYKEDIMGMDTKVTINAMYLQLPIHIGYKFEITNGINLLAEIGPYVAFGLGGKAKTKVEFLGETEEGDENVFGDKDDSYAKRFDFGIGGAIGAEFGKIAVKVGYDLGLINISHWDEDEAKMKNGNLFLTVGYKF